MAKKIAIIVGTRPNFIKITQFDKVFRQYGDAFDYRLIHTGQHYDKNMSEVFFEQLGIKQPDLFLNIQGMSAGGQIGNIIDKLTDYFLSWQPDLVIVVGDVNSTLAAAIAANKTGCCLAHLESGLRSNDRGMPEEINRMLTDMITDHYFVTEQSGLENLQQEPDKVGKIHFVGNTMIDTLVAFDKEINQSGILEELKVVGGSYALMTMHRPATVDSREGLLKMLQVIEYITKKDKVVFPIHPRTKNNLIREELMERLLSNKRVVLRPPLDYLSFQKLIKYAKFVITDSGGIQEETTFRQVPCITLRPNTERPSTITTGSNILAPFDIEFLAKQITAIQEGSFKKGQIPPLWDGKATERIVENICQLFKMDVLIH